MSASEDGEGLTRWEREAEEKRQREVKRRLSQPLEAPNTMRLNRYRINHIIEIDAADPADALRKAQGQLWQKLEMEQI